MQTIDGKKLNLFSLFNYTKAINSDLETLVKEFQDHVNNDPANKSYYNLIQIVEDLSSRVQDLADRLDHIADEHSKESFIVVPREENIEPHKPQNFFSKWTYKFSKKKRRI